MAESSCSVDGKEYFSRVHFALTDCGRRVLLQLLQRRVAELTPKDHPAQPWSLDDFLNHNMADILLSFGKNNNKKLILYPGFGIKTDLSKWDIPLFVFVLLNACKLDDNDRQLKHDIDNLRQLRNKMLHKGTPVLNEQIYHYYLGRVVGAVQRLCDYMHETDLKKSLLKELGKYGSLRHVYQNGLISELGCKSVDIINDTDSAVENGLQQMKMIIEKRGLSVNIPVLDVMVMFRNYNKEDEEAITEHLLGRFSEALDMSVDKGSSELDDEVKSLVRKLFDEKKEITKVSRGCLILSIQCHAMDAVISLVRDSLSGKLGSLFEPLEEVMQTHENHVLFEVCVGITRKSCWALLNDMFFQVSDICGQRSYTVESTVQGGGILVRIQRLLQSFSEKKVLEKSFSSKEKEEICDRIMKELTFDLKQPGMDMVIVSPKNSKADGGVEELTTGSASGKKTFDLKTKFPEKDSKSYPPYTNPKTPLHFGGETTEVSKRMQLKLHRQKDEMKQKLERLAILPDTLDLKLERLFIREQTALSYAADQVLPCMKSLTNPEISSWNKDKEMKEIRAIKVKSKYESDTIKFKEDQTLLDMGKLRLEEKKSDVTFASNDEQAYYKHRFPFRKTTPYTNLGNKTYQRTGRPIHRSLNISGKRKAKLASESTNGSTLKNLWEMVLETDGHRVFDSISGMAVVGDRFLVAIDSEEDCVRCFDMDNGKQQASWYDSGFLPWGITTIPGNRVAVTSPHKVWFLRVTEKGDLLFENIINVKERCFAIASSGDNLIVSNKYPDHRVHILDMKGNVIKEFKTDDEGENLFVRPSSLAVSPDHSTIYIADDTKNTVTSLTQDGRILGVVDVKVNRPFGSSMTVDSAGRVYVCGYDTVFLVSPETRTVIPLLKIEDWIMHYSCVAVCDKTQRLYLSLRYSNVIQVFEVLKHTTA